MSPDKLKATRRLREQKVIERSEQERCEQAQEEAAFTKAAAVVADVLCDVLVAVVVADHNWRVRQYRRRHPIKTFFKSIF